MKIGLGILLFFQLNFSIKAQETINVNKSIIKNIEEPFEIEKPKKRMFLNHFEHKNPLNYIASSLLFVYQNVISEQISANCNFEISCSEYTKRAISKYGLIKGSLMGIHQLSCCHEQVKKDFVTHRISKKGKIKNEI